ncbi:aldehyde dehydrogenase family protein [Rhodococcus tibetensis]|uniref:Aldehyde dehydrogenase family protein n=1 Tax=Rhodococcus tibetensis TaxID=2965064 RepID=A0ABT1QKL3_9NOCA|nr:aldehyde dehydrogenase family protein [Rhodococcus sp. FXJ9.536]MCQ4122325.1 aldehyde dehydrogenase family protein [Rhodococcus sp. FXJ9.536]
MTAIEKNGAALHWIDGEWVDSPEHGTSVNPATGIEIGTYAIGGAAETEHAIDIAERVFKTTSWRFDRPLRARVLNAMAARFEARADELATLLSQENGKILRDAQFEVGMAAPVLRFNAALALTDTGRSSQVQAGRLGLMVRDAAGVAGVIAPWNAPVALALRSIAPALAAGTTTVVSLPVQTAQTNALIAEIIATTPELPKGVVNIINGGFATGDTIVRSSRVPVISFTGSTKTGKAIMSNASANLKRVGLELGGKAPMIIFDDADLDVAIPKVVAALTVFAGQFCMTGSRLLVQSGVAEKVREALASRLEEIKVGPGLDPASEMGPIIDKKNVERIDGLVEDAIATGAEVIVRGGPITDGPLAAGSFYRPTLLAVTDPNLPIVQSEVFGPVLCMETFETEAEAVALANNSEYGLSASVFSRDIDLPLRVALQLESGTVWINDWAALQDQFEEGGYKASGQGRMRGFAVIDDFIEFKHIAFTPGLPS